MEKKKRVSKVKWNEMRKGKGKEINFDLILN